MVLFFIYALVETGYQLIDFLFSGDLHSTSLSVRLGAVSDTELLGWNKMMNWLFDLHIVFVFVIVLLASLAGEFFLAKFIKHNRRWRSVRVIQELSRHENMTTTQRYIDVSVDKLKKSVETVSY